MELMWHTVESSSFFFYEYLVSTACDMLATKTFRKWTRMFLYHVFA